MKARVYVFLIFAGLLASLAFTLTAGIWTGDVRWLRTAWLPGSLALLNFCFLPLILMMAGDDA